MAHGKWQIANDGLRFTLLLLVLLLGACAPDVVKHNATGNAHFEDAAYQDAVTAYGQAQVAEPEQAEPYYNAANAYNRQGQVDGAAVQTQLALKTADDSLAAQAQYNLGNAFFDATQWEPAIGAYQEALRLNPADEAAKHNLELALQKLQQQQEQEKQESETQEQETQESENSDSQEQESGTEEQPQSEPSEGEQGDAEQQPSASDAAPSEETQMMSEEQAMQLLQALLGDSETLQEKLQEIYGQPGPQPDEDW